MKKIIPVILLILIGLVFWRYKPTKQEPVVVTDISSYEECVAAGNPILESFPPQCLAGGELFVLDVGNFVEKIDEVYVVNPSPQEPIPNHYTVSGTARGSWFFEASAPIIITDKEGNVLLNSYVTAIGDWMTTEMVPFEQVIDFDPKEATEGYFILKKDNPSGLPEHDDEVRYPIKFTGTETVE